MIVESRPSAGGTLPSKVLRSAGNGGSTLGIASLGIYRLPYTTDLKWDAATDPSYFVGLTGYSFGIVVPAASPIRMWADNIAAAKVRCSRFECWRTRHVDLPHAKHTGGLRWGNRAMPTDDGQAGRSQPHVEERELGTAISLGDMAAQVGGVYPKVMRWGAWTPVPGRAAWSLY